MKPKTKNILEEALEITQGERSKAYGHPKESCQTIADICCAMGITITISDVPIILIALKLARIKKTKNHRDSWVDLAGYSWVGSEVIK